MKIEVLISNMPGVDDKDPAINIGFSVDDESKSNADYVEKAATWAALKNNLTPGRCYIWKISDDEGKRSAGGMVSIGLVAVACEFPREVTDAP